MNIKKLIEPEQQAKRQLSDQELLHRLANATLTHYQASSKMKSSMNEGMAHKWRSELKRRGVTIPNDRDLLDSGRNNGIGSI